MFKKTTWIKLPRNVLVGHDVISDLAAATEELYLDGRPLIITSPTPNQLIGDRVRAQFADPQTILVDHASFDAVEDVIETAEAADVGYLIGLGGGKPIDIAKMASDRLGCAFVSVPTAASHDGIVSGRSSIPEGDTRHSVAADPPLAVIADTAVLVEAPWELTTAGCADIISNYTAVQDWQLAHRLQDVEYSEYAGALSQMTAEMLVDNSDAIKQGFEDLHGSLRRRLFPLALLCQLPDPHGRHPALSILFHINLIGLSLMQHYMVIKSESHPSLQHIFTLVKTVSGKISAMRSRMSVHQQQQQNLILLQTYLFRQ
ncbi:MAG: glycerol dehydrogenase related enzyme [Haloquadratum walsbyi J07HQW2]|uniref:Glycerol dehydrogenase related enzyme n=1 Tax=Haloquadratum walsbyi J07HQW2 TaxID=1238425 RepID=U1N153_9EURY|nr:MAG: glycerol dehydrogenase related enzyme [Haloquadratum walsbyi J07HQW2]